MAERFIDCAGKIARKSNHTFVVATRSDALEVMQGNFGRTIKADGDRSAPHANRGVADHVTIFPWPRAHMPWQNRAKGDRDRPGQTDLTSVGMATDK